MAMADAPTIPDEAEVRARWGGFAWTPAFDNNFSETISTTVGAWS